MMKISFLALEDWLLGGALGDPVLDNVIVACTNQRLFIRPKKGKSIPSKLENRSNLEIELKEIQAVRNSGGNIRKIEIDTSERTYELPIIRSDDAEIVESIVEQEDLVKSDWGKEDDEKNVTEEAMGTASTFLGIGAGVVGAVFGILLIIVGILMTLTLVGAIIGIPLFFIGVWVLTGGSLLGLGSAKGRGEVSGGRGEWIRKDQAKD